MSILPRSLATRSKSRIRWCRACARYRESSEPASAPGAASADDIETKGPATCAAEPFDSPITRLLDRFQIPDSRLSIPYEPPAFRGVVICFPPLDRLSSLAPPCASALERPPVSAWRMRPPTEAFFGLPA